MNKARRKGKMEEMREVTRQRVRAGKVNYGHLANYMIEKYNGGQLDG